MKKQTYLQSQLEILTLLVIHRVTRQKVRTQYLDNTSSLLTYLTFIEKYIQQLQTILFSKCTMVQSPRQATLGHLISPNKFSKIEITLKVFFGYNGITTHFSITPGQRRNHKENQKIFLTEDNENIISTFVGYN